MRCRSPNDIVSTLRVSGMGIAKITGTPLRMPVTGLEDTCPVFLAQTPG